MAMIELLIQSQSNITLDEELSEINYENKVKEKVRYFLELSQVSSLVDVDLSIISRYRLWIHNDSSLSATQRKHYLNAFEPIISSYYKEYYHELIEDISEVVVNRAIKNKLMFFLIISRIHKVSDIDYDLRSSFSQYLISSGVKKYYEYLKALDKLKLSAIKKTVFIREIEYFPGKLFLPYIPDYKIAHSFYYQQDKEELLFDFSISCSETLKRQIFGMLIHILKSIHNRHDRRERFILPLRRLYLYLASHGVDNILTLEETEICLFRANIDGTVGSKTDIYMEIVDNFRKFIFLSSSDIAWDSNVWYLERFNLDGRINPARPIERIKFSQIHNIEHRKMLQTFLRYMLTISSKLSVQTIRTKHYDICGFLTWCDTNQIDVSALDQDILQQYIIDDCNQDIQPEYFNRKLSSIRLFINYLMAKGLLTDVRIDIAPFLRRVIVRHHDRRVDTDIQEEILSILPRIPEPLNLMFLVIWYTGRRINEICTLKPEYIVKNDEGCFISFLLYKVSDYITLIINENIYGMLKDYIERNSIASGSYVFRNRKGGAYSADRFIKEFPKELIKAGFELPYSIKSHDFRHTNSTELYDKGVAISVIREYLGHSSDEMTKDYIDCESNEIMKYQNDYFTRRD